jgi:hypothetical protein
LAEGQKWLVEEHTGDAVIKSEIFCRFWDERRVWVLPTADEYQDIFANCRIADCVLPQHAVNLVCNAKLRQGRLVEESDNGMEVDQRSLTYG